MDEKEAIWFRNLKSKNLALTIVAVAIIISGVASFTKDVKTIFTEVAEFIQLKIYTPQSRELEKIVEKADEIYFTQADNSEVYALYEEAAGLGHTYAKASLAKLLHTGWADSTQDKARAKSYAEDVISELKKSGTTNPRDAYILGIFYEYGIGVSPNEKESFYWYRKSADHGFAPAQHNLATMYYDGVGTDKDVSAAFNLRKAAAKQKHLEATYWVGRAYRYEWGTTPSFEESEYWLLQAFNNQHAGAANELGDFYEEGDLGSPDLERAVHHYRIAMERGNAKGKNNYARMLFFGRGISENKEEAVRLWQDASLKGNSTAQYRLSFRYRDGDVSSIPVDLKESTRLLKLAAESGHQSAQEQLSTDLRLGIGTADGNANFERARYWAELCSKKNNTGCLTELAIMYEGGFGGEKDILGAERLYRKAKSLGDRFAIYRLVRLLGDRGKDRPDLNRERMEILVSATMSHPDYADLWYELGKLYRTELPGLTKDQEKSSVSILKAAELGNVQAANDIGWRYFKGIGVKQDIDRAVSWLKSAAIKGDESGILNLHYLAKNGAPSKISLEEVEELQFKGLMYFEKKHKNHYCRINTLALRYELGKAAPKDLQKANSLYLRAAELGSTAAAYNYARMQFDELALTPNFTKGLYWLKKSADEKWGEAHLLLSKIYLLRIHVDYDSDKALSHFIQAKSLGVDLSTAEESKDFPKSWIALFNPAPLSCSGTEMASS